MIWVAPGMIQSKAELAAADAGDDVGQLIAIVSLALAVEADVSLRERLRQATDCPPDQALILQLPTVPAALEIDPGGLLRPLRTDRNTGAPRLETLLSADSRLRERVAEACAKAEPSARALLTSFFLPGSLPSRSTFEAVCRWAPLVETLADRFAARASSTLDAGRSAALGEAASGPLPADSVTSLYYPLIHSAAHLTLISSDPGAGRWLADMARSFEWTNWTPSFPLTRERTVWLAAAAAKSAAAFGPDVIEPYLHALAEGRHAYKVFDTLFGLTSIALAHDRVLTPIAKAIAAAQDASVGRITAGAEQAPWMFRSALALLQRWEDDRSTDPVAARRLGWDAGARVGLATRQALRLDPSVIDARGQVLGFAALPAIMEARPGEHYPWRSPLRSPLLPGHQELAGLLTRAWGPRRQRSPDPSLSGRRSRSKYEDVAMTEQLLRRVEDGVMTLTFNRPEKKNAITDEMYGALADGLGSAARDDRVRVVLFLSTGDSFTAGNDLASFARQSEAPRPRSKAPSNVERFIKAVADAKKPIVAGVRGRAVGSGLTMLLHCDLVYVAEDAELSAPFVSLALVPEAASSLLLVARVGHVFLPIRSPPTGQVSGKARQNSVQQMGPTLPIDEVDNVARAAAKRLAAQPAEALAITKRLMRDSQAIATRIDDELGHFATRLSSPEAQEAFRAFAERRTPDFAKVEAESWWERSG